MLTKIEKKIIATLQGDIPVTKYPFLKLAETLGISEKKFLEILKNLNNQGIIRRFGATLKHQKSGYKANAMVAWKVEEKRVHKVGEKMALFDEITHCYRRNPRKEWQYNIYTMVHAFDEKSCYTIVEKISKAVDVTEYSLLFSRKELKKISMAYFN